MKFNTANRQNRENLEKVQKCVLKNIYPKMGPLMFFIAAIHLFYTPFTKVEESFNVQAMHDLLYVRENLSQYDHHEFPGVVPRTFIGPLVVAFFAAPFAVMTELVGLHKFWTQYVVRIIISAIVIASWEFLRNTIAKKLGFTVSIWFTLVTVTQFHFMFYMSRPLPNIMALPFVLAAIAFWMRGKSTPFIWFSGVSVIVFRAEVAILLGILLVYDLHSKKININQTIKTAALAGTSILLVTFAIDSFFWGRLIWPEAEVFWYNTVMNKSSNWGTSPFLWYFYSALPRALGFTLLFVPYGMYVEPRIRPIGAAALAFVFLYSFLPHKELRFIVYVFPMLNIAAACACQRIWINRAKSLWKASLIFVAGSHLAGNLIFTLFLLIVSSTNYPGGVAISRLHRIASHEPNVSVHICNLAAQTGVSRFTQIKPNWIYSKKERIKYLEHELEEFSYLLVETKNKMTGDPPALTENFQTIETVECFNNIGVEYNSMFPIRIRMRPCLRIMKRRKVKNVEDSLPIDEEIDFWEEDLDKVFDFDADKAEPKPQLDKMERVHFSRVQNTQNKKTTNNPIEPEKPKVSEMKQNSKPKIKSPEPSSIYPNIRKKFEDVRGGRDRNGYRDDARNEREKILVAEALRGLKDSVALKQKRKFNSQSKEDKDSVRTNESSNAELNNEPDKEKTVNTEFEERLINDVKEQLKEYSRLRRMNDVHETEEELEDRILKEIRVKLNAQQMFNEQNNLKTQFSEQETIENDNIAKEAKPVKLDRTALKEELKKSQEREELKNKVRQEAKKLQVQSEESKPKHVFSKLKRPENRNARSDIPVEEDDEEFIEDHPKLYQKGETSDESEIASDEKERIWEANAEILKIYEEENESLSSEEDDEDGVVTDDVDESNETNTESPPSEEDQKANSEENSFKNLSRIEKIKMIRERHRLQKASQQMLDINFEELRKLAIKQLREENKIKIRKLIERHYRAKGSIIESDQTPLQEPQAPHDADYKPKITVKSIIKQEKVRKMAEKISNLDLMRYCNFEIMTTKECLKKVIDDMDENIV